MMRDVQISLDDASFGVENFQTVMLNNVDLLHKMKGLYAEKMNEGKSRKEESDFDQVSCCFNVVN